MNRFITVWRGRSFATATGAVGGSTSGGGLPAGGGSPSGSPSGLPDVGGADLPSVPTDDPSLLPVAANAGGGARGGYVVACKITESVRRHLALTPGRPDNGDSPVRPCVASPAAGIRISASRNGINASASLEMDAVRESRKSVAISRSKAKSSPVGHRCVDGLADDLGVPGLSRKAVSCTVFTQRSIRPSK